MAEAAKKVNLSFGWLKGLTVVIVLALLAITAFNQTYYTIQFGSVGIVTRFGKIVGKPANPGLHFKLPFVDQVVVYRTQKIVYETLSPGVTANNNYFDQANQTSNADYKDIAVDTTTKDGQQVSVRYSLRFSINPQQIKKIANTLGTESEVVEKIVKTESRIWSRNIPRNYSALDLYTGNIDQVSQEIEKILAPKFEENGLILDSFAIRSINFQQAYVDTIEQKQIERERISTEEYKAQQEEFKKLGQITKAQGEAEAQRLQQQTLNQDLINKLYLEKWDGKLPSTVCGDNGGGLILNLNK